MLRHSKRTLSRRPRTWTPSKSNSPSDTAAMTSGCGTGANAVRKWSCTASRPTSTRTGAAVRLESEERGYSTTAATTGNSSYPSASSAPAWCSAWERTVPACTPTPSPISSERTSTAGGYHTKVFCGTGAGGTTTRNRSGRTRPPRWGCCSTALRERSLTTKMENAWG